MFVEILTGSVWFVFSDLRVASFFIAIRLFYQWYLSQDYLLALNATIS